MEIFQSLKFRQAYKKLFPNQKSIVNEEIKKILQNPKIGEEKKQDLRGIFVHKFKMYSQLFLLAYSFNENSVTLISLGVHENFYRDLKNKL